MKPLTISRAYVLMATWGDNWKPVAAYFDEKTAKNAAKTLGFRLYGPKYDENRHYEEGFSVIPVDFAPKMIATGTKQLMYTNEDLSDENEIDIHPLLEGALNYEHPYIEEPADLYTYATAPERKLDGFSLATGDAE